MIIERYYKLSTRIYLTILSLIIPFFLLLQGASGHGFHITSSEFIPGTIIVLTIILMIIYKAQNQLNRPKKLLLSIPLVLLLALTFFGGITSLIFVLNFEFGTDVSAFVRILFYLVPVTFLLTNYIIFVVIIKDLRKNATDANIS